MTMRASPTESTGTTGQNEVRAAFSRIGWGPVDNPQHDLGTDLWIAARDERGFDLGLMVGAQVKSGSSWFEEALCEGDELVGWWFRDDQKHFDYWLAHATPHLVVLHDLEERKSYWAHVTPDAVQSTGKDSKLLIPAANIVDSSQRQALIEVASRGVVGNTWEGSNWRAGADIPPADHLRHALMVPRLIAPHPNAGFVEPPTVEQVIAMLMQARLFDLRRCSDDFEEIPSPAEACSSEEWSWQFFGALWTRVTDSNSDLLMARTKDAPSPETRAAAAVAAASALTEVGRAEQSLELLNEVIQLDECAPLDQNWLLVQRARSLAEVGEIEAAHLDAVTAQGSRRIAANDATAGAITASASVLLFNTAKWGEHDVRDVMVNSDTASGWWRSQVTARALSATLDRTFKEWAEDHSVTVAAEDVEHNQLEVASLTASHSGDQAGWRSHAARRAATSLMRVQRGDDPAQAAEALGTLRMSGDDKWLVLATRRLSTDGPALAVRMAGEEIDLALSTRTTSYADLKFIQAGGDLMSASAASKAVDGLLALLDDATAFEARCTPSYLLDLAVLEALAGVIASADADMQRRVAERVMEVEPQQVQIYAQAWARLLSALPDSAFAYEDAEVMVANADLHHFPLPLRFLGRATRLGSESSRETLTLQALNGSIDAMVELGDVTGLETRVAEAQIERLAVSVHTTVTDAESGKFGWGTHDICHSLALLNIRHPGVARWEPVLELLGNDAVMVSDKFATLRFLADNAELIPSEVRSPLTEAATRIARSEGRATRSPFDHREDASAEGVYLAVALGAFDQDETSKQITRLLNGSATDRSWAAVIAGQSATAFNRGLLVSLASDDDLEVRTAATAWLMNCASNEVDSLVVAALRQATSDPGRSVPIQVAFGLNRLHESRDDARALAEELRATLVEHPSAQVRTQAVRGYQEIVPRRHTQHQT